MNCGNSEESLRNGSSLLQDPSGRWGSNSVPFDGEWTLSRYMSLHVWRKLLAVCRGQRGWEMARLSRMSAEDSTAGKCLVSLVGIHTVCCFLFSFLISVTVSHSLYNCALLQKPPSHIVEG